MPVKIASVTPIAVSHDTDRETMSFLFVRIETDEGLVGYGEACDSYGCSYASVLATVVSDVLAPLLVGEELVAVDPLAERMRLFTRRRLGDQWVGPQARSAVEIALWDLLARAGDDSVSGLLGRVRDTVEIYASGAFLEEGDVAHHLARLRPLLDRGVRMVKLRTGPDWRADVETLRGVVAELGDGIEVMIDGSETYTLSTALDVAGALADLGVRWFEEPIPQGARAGIEELARRSPVPIAYGEHLFGLTDALDALARHQIHVLQPDAATAGGIAEARRMAQAAAPYGVRVVPHNCAGPVALAANLHLAASVPSIRAIEYSATLVGVWAALGTGAPLGPEAVVDGHLPVPDGPGLGVGLDEDAAAAHPYQPPGARVAGTRSGLPDRFVGDR